MVVETSYGATVNVRIWNQCSRHRLFWHEQYYFLFAAVLLGCEKRRTRFLAPTLGQATRFDRTWSGSNRTKVLGQAFEVFDTSTRRHQDEIRHSTPRIDCDAQVSKYSRLIPDYDLSVILESQVLLVTL